MCKKVSIDCPNQKSNINPNSIKLYKRFIDDFNFWAENDYTAELFMRIINSRRTSIIIELGWT